jgi:hypothetical protein
MSHSKGFLRGTCPGNLKKSGRPRDGQQTFKCGRCGLLKQKRVRPCFLFHDYQNSGKVDHGGQKQKCAKCGDTRKATVRGCGILRSCQYHNCDKVTGLHCRRCGRGRG